MHAQVEEGPVVRVALVLVVRGHDQGIAAQTSPAGPAATPDLRAGGLREQACQDLLAHGGVSAVVHRGPPTASATHMPYNRAPADTSWSPAPPLLYWSSCRA